MRILFIPSNENQIKVMEPSASVLKQEGNEITFLSLDNYYNQYTNEALRELNFNYIELSDKIQTENWWCLDAQDQSRLIKLASFELEEVFSNLLPDAIVLGNSLGELEQLSIKAANRLAISTVLIQDGVISNLFPKINDTPLPSVMTGPCDLICTWNEHLKEKIRRQTTTPRLAATGAARYDILANQTPSSPQKPYRVMVATQCYSNYKMRRAVDEIAMYERIVHRLLAREDIGTVVLRPHPQTNILSRYEELANRLGSRVELQVGGDSVDAVREVDCVIATFSTVLIAACISGTPIAELSYLTKHDTEQFLKFDEAFENWIHSESFPSNFFTTRANSLEEFRDTFCPISDGQSNKRIVEEIKHLVESRSLRKKVSAKKCTVITELHQKDPLLSINSILGGQSNEVEVIAIDRSTFANAKSMLDPIFAEDSRLRIMHMPNTPKTKAYVQAVEESNGDYLIFLDQNAVLLPGVVDFTIETFDAYPKTNNFLGSGTIAGEEALISQILMGKHKNSLADFLADKTAGIFSKCIFIRKSSVLANIPTECPDNEVELHILNASNHASDDKRIIISARRLFCYPYVTSVSHQKSYLALANKSQEPANTSSDLDYKVEFSRTKAPEISVLLCSYNREDKVSRCLEALENQSIDSSRFEIICVNDGSTDNTGQRMKDGLQRLQGTYIEHQSNKALAAARNTALSAAKGDYLLFINDDTYATPTFLEEHLKTHQEHGAKDIAVAGYLPFIEQYKNRVFSLALMDANLYFGYSGLPSNQALPFWFFITGNLSVPRRMFERHNIRFNETFTRYGYEDIECGYRLWQKGLNVYYNPQAQAIHDHLLTIENFVAREENNAANILQFCAMHPDPIIAENLLTTRRLSEDSIQQWQQFVEGARPRIPDIISQISDVQEIVADMKTAEARARAQHLIKEVGDSTRLVALYVKLATFLEVFEAHPELKQTLMSENWSSAAEKKFAEIGYQAML